MKVIDLKKRTIYVDDIEQIYCENNYSPERYNIQTTHGTYLVDKEDYFKVKDYLLSLNDEVKIKEEEPRDIEVCGSLFTKSEYDKLAEIKEDKKIEKIETYDKDGNIFIDDYCFKYVPIDKHNLTDNEQVFVEKINEIIKFLYKTEKDK